MRLASVHTYPIKGCHRLDHDSARIEPWGFAGDRRWMIVDENGVAVTQRRTPRLAVLRPRPRPGGIVLRGPDLPELDLPEPTDGEPIEARVFAMMPQVAARVAANAASDWLTAALDRKVRLVWLGDPTGRLIPDPEYREPGDRVSFADGFPVLLTTTASLDTVNAALLAAGSPDAPLSMARFRPNLVVDGCRPWQEEEWTGRRLRIGPVVFRVGRPCPRCLVTTVDQETGVKGHEPLRVLAAIHNVNQALLFGQNLVPQGIPADGTGPVVTVGDPVELLA